MVDRNREKRKIFEKPDKSPGCSVGGYFVMLGQDSDEFGPGGILILQGRSMVAKFSYVDWQKIDAFMTQNSQIFNEQLDKETAVLAAVKKR